MDVPPQSLPTKSHGSDKTDLYGGIALGVAVLAAMLIANSAFGHAYEDLLHATGEIRIGSIGLAQSLDHWINDGLMAVFFLLVGLEIKREVLEGGLSSPQNAALPVIAAIGGFVVPAAIYAALNCGNDAALRGWAVSSATDIAFALGLCAVLGRAIPPSLKTFLLALAIIDDLMAIIVIGIFYTDTLSVLSLALAAVGIAGLVVLNLLDVRKPALYVVVGLFTWVCVLKSGVHASLAGVAVGFAMPLTRHAGRSLLEQVEHALKPWVSCVIVPIFAFANAGVSLAGIPLASLTAPIPLGIVAGLCVGKQLGVFLPSMAAIRLGLARLPAGASMGQLYGIAVLTGVGFTMSLFIGTLAFDDETIIALVQLAVLASSVVAAVAASIILMVAAARQTRINTGAC
jgi:NhaA family Na+:H+ antiporter